MECSGEKDEDYFSPVPKNVCDPLVGLLVAAVPESGANTLNNLHGSQVQNEQKTTSGGSVPPTTPPLGQSCPRETLLGITAGGRAE